MMVRVMGQQSPPRPTRGPPTSRLCLAPNPDNPAELCLHYRGPGHEGEHTWWYCLSEFGDYPSLDCERKRGHEGDHEGHWA